MVIRSGSCLGQRARGKRDPRSEMLGGIKLQLSARVKGGPAAAIRARFAGRVCVPAGIYLRRGRTCAGEYDRAAFVRTN